MALNLKVAQKQIIHFKKYSEKYNLIQRIHLGIF